MEFDADDRKLINKMTLDLFSTGEYESRTQAKKSAMEHVKNQKIKRLKANSERPEPIILSTKDAKEV